MLTVEVSAALAYVEPCGVNSQNKIAYRLNPNVTTKSNLIDYYSNIVSQVANTGAVFKSIYENEDTTVSSTDNARQQIVGVSDEEELSNMIKFQNAYNASSRYINVIDQLLEHIINTLGA